MELETVLVAVGPTEENRVEDLTESVCAVAGPAAARVVLFHSFTESAFEDGVRETGHDPDDPPEPAAVAARLASVDAMSSALDELGIEYEIRSAIGSPKATILDAIEAVSADMVFVGGRSRSPVGKAIVGSTSQRVLMNATCPVVFVRDGTKK
jgi:nucleotide-binding universal stress UspA family protein